MAQRIMYMVRCAISTHAKEHMEQFNPDIINDVSTCDDAKQYAARINDAESTIERIARVDAFSNHVALCATCKHDGLFAIESNE